MSDQWGPRENVPDRAQRRMALRERVPGTSGAEQVYLAIGAVALTVAALSCFFDRLGAVEIERGVYAILVGLFVVGGHGWTVCRAESRVRQEVDGKVTEMTAALAELRDLVAHQRVAYIPAPRKHQDGQRYVGSVPVRADDTATIVQRGIDEECIAAARRITQRLRSVDNP